MKRTFANLNKAMIPMMVAMMMASCQSNADKLARVDNEIRNADTQIEKLRETYSKMFTDSLFRNPEYAAFADNIGQSDIFFLDMIDTNQRIKDTILNKELNKMAQAYPLSSMLSPAEYEDLVKIIVLSDVATHKSAAQRIMLKKGTLLDLNDALFEIDYNICDLPFYIGQNDRIVFKNPRRNAKCAEFYSQKAKIEQMLSSAQGLAMMPKAYHQNLVRLDSIMAEYKKMDSLAQSIESHFDKEYAAQCRPISEQKRHLVQRRCDIIAHMSQNVK